MDNTRDSPDSDDRCHVIAGFQTAEPAERKIGLSGEDILDRFLHQLDETFRLVHSLKKKRKKSPKISLSLVLIEPKLFLDGPRPLGAWALALVMQRFFR